MRLWQAFADEKLLGASFEPRESWTAHLAWLKVLEGHAAALTPAERELAFACTGRETFEPAREAELLCGRRSGKSRLCSALAVGLAVLREWPHLAAGEVGRVLLLSASRTQAKALRDFVQGIVDASALIRGQVTRENVDSIDFGRTRVEVAAAHYRRVRGFSACALVMDEFAHWIDEDGASNPASEVIRAARPSLASMPDSLLVAATTPWARTGVAWELYRDYFGKSGDVLVWHSPSVRMNPAPWLAAEVAREERRDPVNAATEYGAQFRTDVESFLSREQLESCIRSEGALPARSGVKYLAFTDSSGGVSDSYTLALAHREQRDGRPLCVVDRVEERRPPFDPRSVTRDFAALLRAYGVRGRVQGDRYSAEWTAGAWRAEGFAYEPSPLTASELYRALVPALLAGDVELPDDERLVGQLLALERRATRGGREQITHPPHGHDDVAVACAGVVALVLSRRPGRTARDLYAKGGIVERLDRALEAAP